MTKRAKLVLLVVLTLSLVIGLAGAAFAVPPAGGWTDLSYSDVGKYVITLEQVGMISDGYTDGSWKPYASMTRAHFIKMAVEAYNSEAYGDAVPLKNPATPTFTDVPTTHPQYQYIEAAAAAGLTTGVGGGLFKPEDTITREQAAAIIVRWVAQKNGYDYEAMYTDAEAAAILAAFSDGASVSATLTKEIAFGVDMGVIWGKADGKLAPAEMMLRLQGAAMIIRSWSILPYEVPAMPPADIDVVAGDGAENLVGQIHTVTFKVVDEDGAPVEGALVDFDTLTDPLSVGNVQPAAALTDANGEVEVNLISTELGTQRISALVRGDGALYMAYATKYWLGIDEVYITDVDRTAQNNVGVAHEWCARVVVFGPGPLSTSRNDWYNVYLDGADLADLDELDAIDWNWWWYGEQSGSDVPWSYQDELDILDEGWTLRTMAGIDVEWSIFDTTSVTSVGYIQTVDGVATTGMPDEAVGTTDEDGLSCITIYSEDIGATYVQAVADYDENPYPKQLVRHEAVEFDDWDHWMDWDDQPSEYAEAYKTWIAHTIGGEDGPISPAYSELNVGEEELLTITLVDTFGNPVAGKTVEWFMKGVGMFKDDDDRVQSGDNTWGVDDRDIDVTDANGTARLLVKSTDPGEQLVIAEVRDKGTGGNEGTNLIYEAEIQWFKIDVATFDHPATSDDEAVAINEVATEHTFDVWVYGLKLEYFPALHYSWEGIDNKNNQTPWIDTDAAGKSYDGIMDADDAEYLDPNGILLVNEEEVGGNYDPDTGMVWDGYEWFYYTVDLDGVNNGYAEITLGAGGITEYDWDGDGFKESVADANLPTGIYLPLAGKGVDFVNDGPKGSIIAAGVAGSITYAGTVYDYDAVTDDAGHAFVTITSTLKGDQWVEAIVNYPQNPFQGTQLLTPWAHKIWTTEAVPNPGVVVTVEGANIGPGGLAGPNAVIDENGQLNYAHVEVHVLDEYGNELPDYEVVYELINLGQYDEGTQDAADTYTPWAVLMDVIGDEWSVSADLDNRYPDVNPWTNAAATQTYEEFTNLGNSGADFSAEQTRQGTWAWELAVTGLRQLPVDPAKVDDGVYTHYALWVNDGPQGLVLLATFNTEDDGALEDGKIFGTTDIDLELYGEVLITAEKTGDPQGAGAAHVLGGAVSTSWVYDGNGCLPDNSEPRNDDTDPYQEGVGPADGSEDSGWADPLATIVGTGGTESYYTWRDDANPPEENEWCEGDGAKAWTLNGDNPMQLHGSSIDIQLTENPYAWVTDDVDVRSILNIQIYAPDNGPTVDGTPWRVFEIQKVWMSAAEDEWEPVLEPEEDANLVGTSHTVEVVAPFGADLWDLYYIWYVDGEKVDEGYGYYWYSWSNDYIDTDEVTVTVWAEDPADDEDDFTSVDYIGTASAIKYWVDPVVDVEPNNAWNPVDGSHTLTATLTGLGDWTGTVSYDWLVATGPNAGTAATQSTTGGENQTNVWTYSNASGLTGTDTIVVTADLGDGIVSPASTPVTKNWLSASVTLDPAVGINLIGTNHELTATINNLGAFLGVTLQFDWYVDGVWDHKSTSTTGVSVWSNYTKDAPEMDSIVVEVSYPADALFPVLTSNTAEKYWVDPTADLTPLEEWNKVGYAHAMDVVVSGLEGYTGSLTYEWSMTGANDFGTVVASSTGASSWSYGTGTTLAGVGDDTIKVTVKAPDGEVLTTSNEVTKHWVDPSFNHTPQDDTNLVGDFHTVRHAISDMAGYDGDLYFYWEVVSGPNAGTWDDEVIDAAGMAAVHDDFTYQGGSDPGTDTISCTVYKGTDDSGQVWATCGTDLDNDCPAPATKTWVAPAIDIQQWVWYEEIIDEGMSTQIVYDWSTAPTSNVVGDVHYLRVDPATIAALGAYIDVDPNELEDTGLTFRWLVRGDAEPLGEHTHPWDAAYNPPLVPDWTGWTARNMAEQLVIGPAALYAASGNGWNPGALFAYTKHVASQANGDVAVNPDEIYLAVYYNDVLVGMSDELSKTWVAGDPAHLVNPWWIINTDWVTDVYPFDGWQNGSKYADYAQTLPSGTVLYYAAQVVDEYGNWIFDADVTDAYPKIYRVRDDTPGTVGQGPYAPDVLTTDSQGFLYWMTNTGWNGTDSGDEGNVTFWLDLDNSGVIEEAEDGTSPAPWIDDTYWAPYFHWLFD